MKMRIPKYTFENEIIGLARQLDITEPSWIPRSLWMSVENKSDFQIINDSLGDDTVMLVPKETYNEIVESFEMNKAREFILFLTEKAEEIRVQVSNDEFKDPQSDMEARVAASVYSDIIEMAGMYFGKENVSISKLENHFKRMRAVEKKMRERFDKIDKEINDSLESTKHIR
jgi:hypothetical protein